MKNEGDDLRFALYFIINPLKDDYIKFDLLTEDMIKQLNLDNFSESNDKGMDLELLQVTPCIKVFNSYEKMVLEQGIPCYHRVIGFKIEESTCKDCTIDKILRLLRTFDFNNYDDIRKLLKEGDSIK